MSFSHSVFPDKLKIAKIIPVFKSDDLSLFSNYRPATSVIPCLLRSLRNPFTLGYLTQFLAKFNLLNHHQYGLRPHHYTSMAILELISRTILGYPRTYEGFENNDYVVGDFIDLLRKHLRLSTARYLLIHYTSMASVVFHRLSLLVT